VKIDLYELTRYFPDARSYDEDRGEYVVDPVLGEERNALITMLAYVLAERPVIIHGWAGTGKTKISNAVLALLPEKELLRYRSSSEKNIWYQGSAITRASYVYVSELQKAGQQIIEVLKDWGEGVNAKYDVTDVTMDKEGDQTRSKVLPCRPYLTTLALENKNAEINPELWRRVITLVTRTDKEHTQAVVKRKLEMASRSGAHLVTYTDDEFSALRAHIARVLPTTNIKVIIPGSEALFDYIPTTFRIVMSQTDYLIDFIAAVTRFHALERITIPDSKYGTVMLATPEDIYCAWEIFGAVFVDYCIKLDHERRGILRAMGSTENTSQGTLNVGDDSNRPRFKDKQIQRRLRDMDLNYTPAELKRHLIAMAMDGYLDSDDNGWHLSDLADAIINQKSLDMEYLTKEAVKNVQQEFPGVSDKFIKENCININFLHPLTGVENSFEYDFEFEDYEEETQGGIV